jgi:hypothetical protein
LVARCFVAHGSPLTMSQTWPFVYPQIKQSTHWCGLARASPAKLAAERDDAEGTDIAA